MQTTSNSVTVFPCRWTAAILLAFVAGMNSPAAVRAAAPKNGNGEVTISGDLKQWHKVTLTLDGPVAREADEHPNAFTDYRMTVTFRHESGSPQYVVPGYFAADGNAAHSSADSGTQWRAHLSPDKTGRWDYQIAFVQGTHVALDSSMTGKALAAYDGKTGSFEIAATDKTGRDFRGQGRLQYVGKHHLRFAGTGHYFLKAGPDSPETLLAYSDFDGTHLGKAKPRPGEAMPGKDLHHYEPHLSDWRRGDPTWRDGKGKGLIGALNYLADSGCNAFSFLTYNAGGDGDNVWPFVQREDKLHYDCSKLDQWQIVFDHAQRLGLYLHFKLQETENDDNRSRLSVSDIQSKVTASLDGGNLGIERKLYCRELIARFGYELALNWNLGEENTQTPEQQRAMAQYIHDTDPYHHHLVVHTYPNEQDRVYPELLGDRSSLTGASLQNPWSSAHQRTLKWVTESAKAGRPWVVANDEQNPASLGVPPDAGYEGFSGQTEGEGPGYNLQDIRKATLWGTIMAGGAGVEYYFGYKLPQNDLVCEDFRSRDTSWEYCRIALDFFRMHQIPYWEMTNADALVGNAQNDNSRYCLAKPGSLYLVYLPTGGTSEIDLTGVSGTFTVRWFNPRHGGPLQQGSVANVSGGGKVALGTPPSETSNDWLIVVSQP